MFLMNSYDKFNKKCVLRVRRMIRANHDRSNINMLDQVDTSRNVIFSTFLQVHKIIRKFSAIKKGKEGTLL